MPTPAVRAAVAAAQARGTLVVLATGRSFVSARKFAAAFNLRTPVISLQGAAVRADGGNGPSLLSDPLPPDLISEVVDFALACDLEMMLYGERNVYVGRTRHPQEFYHLWFGLPVRRCANLPEAARRLAAAEGLAMKSLAIVSPEEGDRLMPELEARFAGRLTVVRSHQLFVEILSPTASKGAAVAFLAQRFGIPQSETLAVGDAGNDVSMVQWAGLGVAVANASPDVLAAADWIAPSVHEDGVATVIERFILNDGRI